MYNNAYYCALSTLLLEGDYKSLPTIYYSFHYFITHHQCLKAIQKIKYIYAKKNK